VRWIVRTLESAGYETWAVGGAIRDAFLRIEHEDWDLATAARPDRVRQLFKRTVPIGVDHGTVGILARDGTLYEVTTFRRDVQTFGRHAVVEFADHVDDDLARRDFTINAMAWHPLREELKDPFEGLEDLERGRLRTVGEPADRFSEDYLRVLRALRFAGRYRLEADAATWQALCQAVEHLPRLSAERIRDELMKVLALDPQPSGALSLLAASGALSTLVPELDHKLDAAGTAPEDPWTVGVLAADLLPMVRPLLRLGAVLQGVGKVGAAQVLLRLRFSNAEARDVSELVDALERGPGAAEAEAVRRWLARIGPNRLTDWARVEAARARVRAARGGAPPEPGLPEVWRISRRELRGGAPLNVDALAIGGRDLMGLGLRPGPAFGRILAALLDRALADPTLNTPDRLLAMAEELAEEESAEPDGGGDEVGA
jgi:tRNA nucleotidyltransferase (CCA-adding enzyme)